VTFDEVRWGGGGGGGGVMLGGQKGGIFESHETERKLDTCSKN